MVYYHKDYGNGNRNIHLGLVYQCSKNSRYGLLYGFAYGEKNKLFYFEKELELEIPQHTLVSYLAYDMKEFSSKAEYVYPVSSLTIHRDERGKYREDNVYHDDESWRLINEGIPYFDYKRGDSYCIYYPIISNNVCTIWSGLFGVGIYMHKEAEIYEMYKELTEMNYSGWPSAEVVAKAISEFKEYTDSVNAYEVLEHYCIWQEGTYYSRPGKDDHYRLVQYNSLSSDDPYLMSLLPNKQEEIFFDNDAKWWDDYMVGNKDMPEEANMAIEKAKSDYSKEKHLAYLINDYYTKVVKVRDRYDFLKKEIAKAFDIDKAERVASWFNGELTDIFLEKLNSYNHSGS